MEGTLTSLTVLALAVLAALRLYWLRQEVRPQPLSIKASTGDTQNRRRLRLGCVSVCGPGWLQDPFVKTASNEWSIYQPPFPMTVTCHARSVTQTHQRRAAHIAPVVAWH